jgi:methyl-accepting chemotaxis protein
MGPAIERILQENVYSIVAAEEMLAAFADAGDAALLPAARARVVEAVDKARQNVTEDEERPVLAMLEDSLPAAMSGILDARNRVLSSIGELIRINREAMRDVDREARRLGSAGAWAAVFVGFLSFLLSIVVVVRLQNRFVRPLVDLYEVLDEAHRGNRLRRCRPSDAPREVVQVTRAVNRLLDERLGYVAGHTTTGAA